MIREHLRFTDRKIALFQPMIAQDSFSFSQPKNLLVYCKAWIPNYPPFFEDIRRHLHQFQKFMDYTIYLTLMQKYIRGKIMDFMGRGTMIVTCLQVSQ